MSADYVYSRRPLVFAFDQITICKLFCNPYSVPSPRHFLSYPPIHFPRFQHSSRPTSTAVGLLTALLPLYVLGVGGVAWIPLDPACTPIPAVMSVMPPTSTTVTSAPGALTYPIIVSATESSSIVYSSI